MNDDHIARLESEIQYLKGLLDENGIPYDYEAFVEAAKWEVSNGSMNLLSRGREDDSLMRIISLEIAAELLGLGMNSSS